MVEKDQVFSSKIKYNGIFDFGAFYKFCYDYLTQEMAFAVAESKYAEKLTGDSKNIDIEWKGTLKINDYFKYEIKVEFQIIGLTNIEIERTGKKIKTNKGSVEVKMKGVVIRDYRGEWEVTPTRKFMREVYDKWVIPGKKEKTEDKLIEDCNQFLEQAKAYLDLEGKK